jgi:hypothetical protein
LPGKILVRALRVLPRLLDLASSLSDPTTNGSLIRQRPAKRGSAG